MQCSGTVEQDEHCLSWVCEDCYEATDAVGIYPDRGDDGCVFFICAGCEQNWEPHDREVCFAVRVLCVSRSQEREANVDADIVVSMTFDVRDKSTLDQDFCES